MWMKFGRGGGKCVGIRSAERRITTKGSTGRSVGVKFTLNYTRDQVASFARARPMQLTLRTSPSASLIFDVKRPLHRRNRRTSDLTIYQRRINIVPKTKESVTHFDTAKRDIRDNCWTISAARMARVHDIDIDIEIRIAITRSAMDPCRRRRHLSLRQSAAVSHAFRSTRNPA